jgi:LPS O-antigen subunit length determinant protein (WzzB/FepE family)
MQQPTSEFDRVLAFLWRYRVTLLVLMTIGGAAGAGISYFFKPQYRAEAILIPSDESIGSENGSLGGAGGLASLIGMSSNGNKDSEAIQTLKSRALTTLYIKENNLLPILFHDRWDPATKTWKTSAYRKAPTLDDAYRLFDKRVRNVIDNRKTGLVTLQITWSDPVLAKQWTDGIVDATNDLLRNQAIARSTRNLDYLKKASEATNVVEIKSTIYKLVEGEVKKQMLASGGRDFAYRVVDPAVVPDRKVFPIRSLFLAFGALIMPVLWLGFRGLKNLKGRVAPLLG